jgi:hypothetical protein
MSYAAKIPAQFECVSTGGQCIQLVRDEVLTGAKKTPLVTVSEKDFYHCFVVASVCYKQTTLFDRFHKNKR